MVSKRNSIIDLINYLQTLGIEINIGKNKARGNKGIFITSNGKFRIDVAKNLPDDVQLKVILHEFSHYIHYKHDKTLNSLDFIFQNISPELEDELINITAHEIPKDFAVSLFSQKKQIKDEIKELVSVVKKYYPTFKLSEQNMQIEKSLTNPVRYLLKYDKINFFCKTYSIEHLENDFTELNAGQIAYIHIKSKQRMIKRINARICKINQYYNKPAELFARFVEMFFTNPSLTKKIAPIATTHFQSAITNNKLPELSALASFF